MTPTIKGIYVRPKTENREDMSKRSAQMMTTEKQGDRLHATAGPIPNEEAMDVRQSETPAVRWLAPLAQYFDKMNQRLDSRILAAVRATLDPWTGSVRPILLRVRFKRNDCDCLYAYWPYDEATAVNLLRTLLYFIDADSRIHSDIIDALISLMADPLGHNTFPEVLMKYCGKTNLGLMKTVVESVRFEAFCPHKKTDPRTFSYLHRDDLDAFLCEFRFECDQGDDSDDDNGYGSDVY